MPDNANPKYQILVALLNIQQDANNYMESKKSLNPFQRYR